MQLERCRDIDHALAVMKLFVLMANRGLPTRLEQIVVRHNMATCLGYVNFLLGELKARRRAAHVHRQLLDRAFKAGDGGKGVAAELGALVRRLERIGRRSDRRRRMVLRLAWPARMVDAFPPVATSKPV